MEPSAYGIISCVTFISLPFNASNGSLYVGMYVISIYMRDKKRFADSLNLLTREASTWALRLST